MAKKGLARTLIVLALAFTLTAFIIWAPIYLGTVEGYAKYMNGSLATGANISVSVSGCSTTACGGNTTTGSNGYYVIANLDMNAGATISGTARKPNGNGSNSTTADTFQAAYLNITICVPPSSPSLTDQGNTHGTNVSLSWTSGTDPLSLSQFDTIVYEGTPTNTSSPHSQTTGVNATSNTTRTWGVRTCNALCCSPLILDNFTAVNDAPPAPTQSAVPDTHDQNATFYWTNFSDPDGDSTYNQFQLDNNSVVTNATSPQNTTGLSFANHTWRVRTCDSRGACSAYINDSWTVGNTAPGTPNITFKNGTNSLTISFEWTSGVDSEGDATDDEIYISNDSSFSYMLYQNTNATSPVTITNATFYQTIFWKVRTCDSFGSCSANASNQFVTYDCNATSSSGGGSSGGGGGGGSGGGSCECQNECEAGVNYCRGDTRVVCGNFDSDSCTDLQTIACTGDNQCVLGQCVALCTPNWVCTEWSGCEDGQGAGSRVCTDLNVCGTNQDKPAEQQSCQQIASEQAQAEQGKKPTEEKPISFLGVSVPATIDVAIPGALVPVGALVVAISVLPIIAFGVGSLLFKEEAEHVLLRVGLWRAHRMISKGQIGSAYGMMLNKVEPMMKKVTLNAGSALQRETLKLYHDANNAVHKALAETARQSGEHGLAAEHARKAASHLSEATKYGRQR